MIALITIFKGDGGEKLNLRARDIAIWGPVFGNLGASFRDSFKLIVPSS